jgi:hypothetical protein
VTDGVVPLAALLVPPACAPVEVTDALGLLARDTCPEDIREQVVIPVPLAPSVERNQKEIPSIEVLQRGLATIQSGDRIAQRTGQPIEDARPQEESAHVRGLSLEHFLREVVDNETIVSRETRDEVVHIVSVLHRQGGQLEHRDPALRPLSSAAICLAPDPDARRFRSRPQSRHG